MPKIKYRDYKPKPETREIIAAANRILVAFEQQGYRLTLRQLYYQFIGEDLFPESYKNAAGTKNNIQSYNKLKNIIGDAREAGLIDWNHIADRLRERVTRPQWEDPKQFLESVCPQFSIDRWENQTTRVEVWIEKDALAEVVKRACKPFDVPFMVCRGYISASAIWEAAHDRFLDWWNYHDQSTVIIHLSDHDPSGIDMTRDIERRLRLFSTQHDEDFADKGPPDIEVVRVALTREQIEEYNPPPNPAKESDVRFKDYERIHGSESWELDALTPAVIVDVIQSHIQQYVDADLYNEKLTEERNRRRKLMQLSARADAIIRKLPELGDAEHDQSRDGAKVAGE